VREDPARGFYVENLSEYTVGSFAEACALLNWGLAHRVLGSTRMNATSSRSHTLLVVKVEARTPTPLPAGSQVAAAASAAPLGYRVQRSQLMLCDLAGSERVRRTSSRGARLGEARAINASLHTLGQVISALALQSAATAARSSSSSSSAAPHFHIPWRDNKLTRLLYGNLGGSANTYLLATLGPCPLNASESLSTLNFASRCMRVSAHPVAVGAVRGGGGGGGADTHFAELATSLQAKLAGLEAGHSAATRGLVRR